MGGIAIAVVAGPVTGVIAIAAGTGGSLSAAHSIAQGNSSAQVTVDAAKGTFRAGVTATAGRFGGGAAGPLGGVVMEANAAYAATKAVGGSNAEAGASAFAATVVGLLTIPLGSGNSQNAAAIAGTAVRSALKGEAKHDVQKGFQCHPKQGNNGNSSQGC